MFLLACTYILLEFRDSDKVLTGFTGFDWDLILFILGHVDQCYLIDSLSFIFFPFLFNSFSHSLLFSSSCNTIKWELCNE